MKKLIGLGISYVESNVTCDVCGGAVEFSGVPEDMYLSHQDHSKDMHEPEVDLDGLLEEAQDALHEGNIDMVNEMIRAFVALDAMTYDEQICIESYRYALRVVSE